MNFERILFNTGQAPSTGFVVKPEQKVVGFWHVGAQYRTVWRQDCIAFCFPQMPQEAGFSVVLKA